MADALSLSYDLRSPDFGAPLDRLYAAALDQAAWADQVGFDAVQVMEHHGSPDGYLPAPLVFASAIAARTSRVRIWISALVLPLHDPVLAAEELAVLDLVSGGRITLVVAAGYRRSEFETFGADYDRRGATTTEGIEVLRRAWSGEPFSHRGREVVVMPRPVQRPGIPIVLGGSTPASARRAARIADGYRATNADLLPVYRDELARRGLGDPRVAPSLAGHPAVFVAEDVEAMWEVVAPHAAYDMNSYVEWSRDQPGVFGHQDQLSTEQVRASGRYLVLTPDEAVARARLGEGLHLKPLLGGLDPDVSWRCLRLMETKVLPHL